MKLLDSYSIESEGVPAQVVISRKDDEFIDTYELTYTKIRDATQVVLNHLKEKIIEEIELKTSEILDPRELDKVKARLILKAHEMISKTLPSLSVEEEKMFVGTLVHEMLGLGPLELLMSDENLEEVVVNSAREPVFVYHKKFRWLKTNLYLQSEEQIYNYSAIVARKVGKQITTLHPLLDAHTVAGHRVNSTLFPISTKGNTITIRKFKKDPWTIIHLLSPELGTINLEVASLLWLAVQYEINILIGGGTASGKTSFLNSIMLFIPPNQRIVSIEDTRELQLPDFLHWTPLTTREPNPEGKGEIKMLDLMVNSLRMRPDRIIVGEIRRDLEAEVLFEAMHTGHAVYSTIHADDTLQMKNRLINPPINLPEESLGTLQLIVAQYRQRRLGIRRTYEIAEIIPQESSAGINVIYKWNSRFDRLERVGEYGRLGNELTIHTGFTSKEIDLDLTEKKKVLEWMLKNKVFSVNEVGAMIGHYYRDKDFMLEGILKKKTPEQLYGGK